MGKKSRRTNKGDGHTEETIERGLEPGDIIEISGLQNAPQYNGSRGIILGEHRPDQNGNLRHPIRLFGHKGKILDVRVSNLQHSRDLDEWKTSYDFGTLLELVQSTKTVYDEDNCGDFAMKLWRELGELGPRHPLTIDYNINIRNEILQSPGHKLFWLAMDAIGHHLLIEKCNNTYRVFQAYIAQNNTGYTGGQWLFSDMRNKSAWLKWGGGKVLSNKDINDLLDLVVKWQKLLETMLKDCLLDQIPGLENDVIPYLYKSPHANSNLPMQLINESIHHIISWSDTMTRRIGPEGCTAIGLDSEQRVLPTQQGVDILMGLGEHVLNIPSNLYDQCDDLSRKMTGEPFVPASLFLMLNAGIWWEVRRQPNGDAIGFGFRGMDLDVHLTEEEGKRRAEKMQQNEMTNVMRNGISLGEP